MQLAWVFKGAILQIIALLSFWLSQFLLITTFCQDAGSVLFRNLVKAVVEGNVAVVSQGKLSSESFVLVYSTSDHSSVSIDSI